ncbi:MAG: hypothetical protein Q7T18_03320 [Sedimentisphaerales bacterium]|nr:hypothetical protein [Sedimentisphaerales bacterium]
MLTETVTIKLPRHYVYQVLDGLKNQADEWKKTKEYMLHGEADLECMAVRECSDEKEAGEIESFYKQIIQTIEQQISS